MRYTASPSPEAKQHCDCRRIGQMNSQRTTITQPIGVIPMSDSAATFTAFELAMQTASFNESHSPDSALVGVGTADRV